MRLYISLFTLVSFNFVECNSVAKFQTASRSISRQEANSVLSQSGNNRQRRSAADFEVNCMENDCELTELKESFERMNDDVFRNEIIPILLESVGPRDYNKLKKTLKRNNCKKPRNSRSSTCREAASNAIFYHFLKPCDVARNDDAPNILQKSGETRDRFCHPRNSFGCDTTWRTKNCQCKTGWTGQYCTKPGPTIRKYTEEYCFDENNMRRYCEDYRQYHCIGADVKGLRPWLRDYLENCYLDKETSYSVGKELLKRYEKDNEQKQRIWHFCPALPCKQDGDITL